MSYSKSNNLNHETPVGNRATSVSLSQSSVPDPEVLAKAKRRRFTAEDKLRILEEADLCTEQGQIGALLRQEGIYSSHLSNWRAERRKSSLAKLSPRARERKPVEPAVKAADEANKRLQRENERLKKRLAYAELIIDIQKKASEMLGIPLKSLDDGENE